ncbi:transcriptional regulator, XRE family with cupin sensor [Thermodesulfobium acidiphilum]|uniref:Transcriptional regulator, XRE family with cupin sensor n=1 Tax=Thermodesulfobium acidiphilum TaxID=1794699 RepID=A0A2R4W0I9_THEAF|nr:XRE family transcriptional regulator [Thermodesulfobium acidiphilum]AWB10285.1 transcriptional regulator, XRE family with cupin sensor [Thermodesulfobium acidiphilum]
MDDLNFIIANNLKKIREKRKLSLDKLSEITGVSKSLLSQIERAESNPTVTTLKKITTGLKISFTALLESPKPNVDVVRFNNITPIIEDGGKYRVYPIFPFDENRRFEIYIVELDKDSSIRAIAHPDRTQEFITVFEGELKVSLGEEELIISKGDSIRFFADKPHIYSNIYYSITRLSMILYYPI